MAIPKSRSPARPVRPIHSVWSPACPSPARNCQHRDERCEDKELRAYSRPRRIAQIFVPLVAFLILAACTEVADFGVYWDRGTLDPALAGRWKKSGLPGEPIDSIPGWDLVVFTNAGASYSLQMINPVDDPALDADERAQRVKDNDVRFEAKTLRLGRRNFLMVRAGDGSGRGAIERYEIKGDLLEEWWLYPAAAEEWLEAKHRR